MSQGKIEVQGLTVNYQNADSFLAIKDINFIVNSGEFVSLMGPSGCGKTTTLHAITGIIKPTSGKVKIDDKLIAYPSKEIQLMFQQPCLFHWKTVYENIAFYLRINKENKKETSRLVSDYLALIGLSKFQHFYPHQLSIGMQQRVSLARALVANPKTILMDEPFRAIDYQKRMQLHEFLLNLKEKVNKTMLLVTHDVDEAILLSDRILLMESDPGRIKKEIVIHFKGKRTYETTTTAKFNRYKKEILANI